MKKFTASVIGVIIICLLVSCAPSKIINQQDLPDYKILKTLDLNKGEAKYGDVLVTSLTKDMDKSYINELFLKISSKVIIF